MRYLLSLLLLFTPLAFTYEFGDLEMDNICYLSVGKRYKNSNTIMPLDVQIRNRGCKRNNIAIISFDEMYRDGTIIPYWCRFDRQIVTSKGEGSMHITCVLYDTESRLVLPQE